MSPYNTSSRITYRWPFSITARRIPLSTNLNYIFQYLFFIIPSRTPTQRCRRATRYHCFTDCFINKIRCIPRGSTTYISDFHISVAKAASALPCREVASISINLLARPSRLRSIPGFCRNPWPCRARRRLGSKAHGGLQKSPMSSRHPWTG